MAQIPALSFAFSADADGWLTPIPSVFVTPEQLYKNHPIANPPRVVCRHESEWVSEPCGLVVRAELPIIDADTGPKVLTNEPPTIELGAGMVQRPSGLFVPPPKVTEWIPLMKSSWLGDSYVISGAMTFTLAMETMTLSLAETKTPHSVSGALDSLVPALGTASAVCPGQGCERAKPKPLKENIIHLNDLHHWTRESIADWLDTLDVNLTVQRKEPKEDASYQIRGPKFDQVIYDEIVGFDPVPLAATS